MKEIQTLPQYAPRVNNIQACTLLYTMLWGIKYWPNERLYVLRSTQNVDKSTTTGKAAGHHIDMACCITRGIFEALLGRN